MNRITSRVGDGHVDEPHHKPRWWRTREKEPRHKYVGRRSRRLEITSVGDYVGWRLRRVGVYVMSEFTSCRSLRCVGVHIQSRNSHSESELTFRVGVNVQSRSSRSESESRSESQSSHIYVGVMLQLRRSHVAVTSESCRSYVGDK